MSAVNQGREMIRRDLADAAERFAAAGSDESARMSAEFDLMAAAGALAYLDAGFDDDAAWQRARDRFADGALDSALS